MADDRPHRQPEMTRVRQVCLKENHYPGSATILVSEESSLGPRPARGVGLVLFLQPRSGGSLSNAGFGAPLFLEFHDGHFLCLPCLQDEIRRA